MISTSMRFLGRTLGWGISIYAIMYLLWSGLSIYGYAEGVPSLIVRLLALAFITILAARSLRMMHWHDVVPYSLGWAAVAIVLDAIFLVPFFGWSLYLSWSVWLGYALVALIPLASYVRLFRRRAPVV
jgi:hypothetical protein